MVDLDFKSFSTRSFERFAQALAFHVLGDGTLIFGDGPDGGREASYEGVLNYPSDVSPWAGYVVMQAKFLQIPREPRQDASWLSSQLTEELNKFIRKESALRKPEYYILVTNARLSPVPEGSRGKGGLEKIDSIFRGFQNQLGLKDWRVWHLDQLNAMLANADALRRSYAAWLCSSDVISSLMAAVDTNRYVFCDAIYRYLARELRNHRPVRLQQAGHGGDPRTMIEDVFTDLPFSSPGEAEVAKTARHLLAHLLERSREKLDGSSLPNPHAQNTGRPERVLLLGGPGQGKSTVTQFLTQIFRANMLATDRKEQVSAEIKPIIDATLNKASAMGLAVAVPRRFPLRVDLPKFADWLFRDDVKIIRKSMIDYVVEEVNRVAGSNVSADDMRKWLREYPSVLVLDGLDEVPASANRATVIHAINDYWDDVVGSDVLMVVTTRPQGYSDELDPNFYSKLEMKRLNAGEAIACAEKLALDRIADGDQRERVLMRMREASKNKTTARLMISPLQVAIMLALIDQRGDAPTDRWNLFDKYFTVVQEREQNKFGAVGDAVKKWALHINSVHYRAGFLLHVEAEKQGNSEAYLSKKEFATLIRDQLADEGYEGDELVRNAAELISVSTERLILLVQGVEDRFSFEVRSLQEFMAAAYLMSGSEAIVQSRLRTIASRTHWLHVFQIAASKCFAVASSGHYRDTIVTLCTELDIVGEPIDQLLRTGSRLALALLDDGLAHDQPKYHRLLISIALGVVRAGPAVLPESLPAQLKFESERWVDTIRQFLRANVNVTENGAWRLLFRSLAQEQGWAAQLLAEVWPDDKAKTLDMITRRLDFRPDSHMHYRMRVAIEASPPLQVQALLRNASYSDNGDWSPFIIRNMPCLELLLETSTAGLDQRIKVFLGGERLPLELRICLLSLGAEQRKTYADLPETEEWEPLRAVREFHAEPSAAALAALLDLAVKRGWLDLFRGISSKLPWPLASLVRAGRSDDDVKSLISGVRSGAFGDTEDWLAAERRWGEQGITERDLAVSSCGLFFDHRIAELGFPPGNISISHGYKDNRWIDKFLAFTRNSVGVARLWLISCARFTLSIYPAPTLFTEETARQLLFEVDNGMWLHPRVLLGFSPEMLGAPEFLDRLHVLGEAGMISFCDGAPVLMPESTVSVLLDALESRPGLLILIVNFFVADDQTRHISEIPSRIIDQFARSENDTVACYSRVSKLMAGRGDRNLARTILEYSNQDDGIELLKKFLLNIKYAREARAASDLMAEAVMIEPRLDFSSLVLVIYAIANGRLSDIHNDKNWQSLQLGEKMFAQIQTRRVDNHPA